MNRLDGFDRLLAEFGESIGIPEMAFDEDGLCHIRVDEEYPITFRRDDDNHNLVLVGLIAEELPERLDREMVREMLATGVEPLRDHGAALGLEPQSGTLILHQTMPLAKIDRTVLETLLGNFILMQKDWSARVAGVGAPGAQADQADQAGIRAGHDLPAGPLAGRPAGLGGANGPNGPAGPAGAKPGSPGPGQPGAKAPAKPTAAEPRYHPHLHHR
ncbi:CesT family type III secretion system chaperone [Cupriavidus sp. H18C1]|uniref:type III secretion system chaperone n=1 Tax=Cupriavidus sp. H18C1 TaxID=3241601 RepID=UPI003BB898D4